MGRLRGVAETLRANAEAAARAHREAQEQVAELSAALSNAREAERRERDAAATASGLLATARHELQRLRDVPPPPPDPRLDELRKELTLLRTQNKCKILFDFLKFSSSATVNEQHIFFSIKNSKLLVLMQVIEEDYRLQTDLTTVAKFCILETSIIVMLIDDNEMKGFNTWIVKTLEW